MRETTSGGEFGWGTGILRIRATNCAKRIYRESSEPVQHIKFCNRTNQQTFPGTVATRGSLAISCSESISQVPGAVILGAVALQEQCSTKRMSGTPHIFRSPPAPLHHTKPQRLLRLIARATCCVLCSTMSPTTVAAHHLPACMLAGVADHHGDRFDMREVPVEAPGPGQVLVKIVTSGVCHVGPRVLA